MLLKQWLKEKSWHWKGNRLNKDIFKDNFEKSLIHLTETNSTVTPFNHESNEETFNANKFCQQ